MTYRRHVILAVGLLAITACTAPGAAPEPASSPGATNGTRGSWDYARPNAAIGEIRLFAGSFDPQGWLPADGRALQTELVAELAPVLGTRYGGDGVTTLNLPNLPPVTIGAVERRYLIAFEGGQPGFEGEAEGLQLAHLGEVRLWAGDKLPVGWLPCDGAELRISDHPLLYQILATRYGGNGQSTFKVPNLPDVGPARYLIATNGAWPDANDRQGYQGDPLRGQLNLYAGDVVPRGWSPSQGQLLPITQNTALFALLGTTFGGNGTWNFALPKMAMDANPNLRYAIAVDGVFPQRP